MKDSIGLTFIRWLVFFLMLFSGLAYIGNFLTWCGVVIIYGAFKWLDETKAEKCNGKEIPDKKEEKEISH